MFTPDSSANVQVHMHAYMHDARRRCSRIIPTHLCFLNRAYNCPVESDVVVLEELCVWSGPVLAGRKVLLDRSLCKTSSKRVGKI